MNLDDQAKALAFDELYEELVPNDVGDIVSVWTKAKMIRSIIGALAMGKCDCADKSERAPTARAHAVQQAQIWAQEARTQKSIVQGILEILGLHGVPDYRAEEAVRLWLEDDRRRLAEVGRERDALEAKLLGRMSWNERAEYRHDKEHLPSTRPAEPREPERVRDESKPPPGWKWFLHGDGSTSDAHVCRIDGFGAGRTLIVAWRQYDAEHGYAPSRHSDAALREARDELVDEDDVCTDCSCGAGEGPEDCRSCWLIQIIDAALAGTPPVGRPDLPRCVDGAHFGELSTGRCQCGKYGEGRPAEEPSGTAPERAPVPMVLHCPECRTRHIDVGEFATKVHHTHSCQSCGLTWRPAVVATVGVHFLPGFKNEPGTTRPPDGMPGERCPSCGGQPRGDGLRCSYCGGEGTRAAYDRVTLGMPGEPECDCDMDEPGLATMSCPIHDPLAAPPTVPGEPPADGGWDETCPPLHPPQEHDLKCWPVHFADVKCGRKRFELRKNDRGYQVGDVLVLRCWDPDICEYLIDHEPLRVRVTHLLRSTEHLAPGYVAMSIEPLAAPPTPPRAPVDEAAVRADERRRTERDIVAHLRENVVHTRHPNTVRDIADSDYPRTAAAPERVPEKKR